MSRSVRLVLCAADGTRLGALPAFAVDSPWWPDAEPVVTGARERFDADVRVLRIVDAETGRGNDHGGPVTYLAELLGDLPSGLASFAMEDEDDPLRAWWARPGGLATVIAWADARLAAIGRPRAGRAEQIKTWNLSSILRLPTADGDVWCKSVPPFLAHEGAILGLVGAQTPHLVPSLLAVDAGTRTVLMEGVPGEDQWDAPEALRLEMVRTLVRVQAGWAARTDELLSAGLPDWRVQTLPYLIDAFARRSDVRARFTGVELSALDSLNADLPRRLASLDECGLPETLVHGDFHPGNWRFDGATLVLLDWGDSGVGHPMLDFSAFDERMTGEARERVRNAWSEAWLRERPGSDPKRAAALIAPVAALRRALIYQGFLDGIEASERRYHDADVPHWVRQALAEME
jgi:Phosphotransferase enzyme family